MTVFLVLAAALGLVAAGIAGLRARLRPGGGDAIRLVTSSYLGAQRFLTGPREI